MVYLEPALFTGWPSDSWVSPSVAGAGAAGRKGDEDKDAEKINSFLGSLSSRFFSAVLAVSSGPTAPQVPVVRTDEYRTMFSVWYALQPYRYNTDLVAPLTLFNQSRYLFQHVLS